MTPITAIFKKKHMVWIFLFVAAGAFFFIGLDHEALWFDETYSAAMIGHSYEDMIRFTAEDVHPPLYYFLLKAVTSLLGSSPAGLRFLSALGALALTGLAAGPVRRIAGEKIAVLFALLIISTPILLSMAHEARMYTLMAFFATASVLYGYLAVREGRITDWVFFGLYTLAAAYTHYYALMTAGIGAFLLFIYILIRDRKKLLPFLITTGAVLLAYLPWIFILANQIKTVAKGFWIQPTNILTILQVILLPFNQKFEDISFSWSSMVSFLVLTFVIIMGLKALKKTGATEPLRLVLFLILVYNLTLMAAVVFSLAVRPILVPRYMTAGAGIVMLTAAVALNTLPNKYIRTICFILLLVLNGIMDLNIQTKKYNGAYSEMIADIDKQIGREDLILHGDQFTLCPVNYYRSSYNHIFLVNGTTNSQEEMDFWNPEIKIIDSLDKVLEMKKPFWLINRKMGSITINKNSILKKGGWEIAVPEKNYTLPASWIMLSACKLIYTGNTPATQSFGDLGVKIGNLKSTSGHLLIALYEHGPVDYNNFFQFDYLPVTAPEMTYTFPDLDLGTYGLFVFHDLNNNYIPELHTGDGVGYSGLMPEEKIQKKAPDFDVIKFELSRSLVVNIDVKYSGS